MGSLTARFVPVRRCHKCTQTLICRTLDAPPFTCSELYDLIIDRFADDVRALTACSLVARAFLPRCQHHLFRYITFYPGDNRWAQFLVDKALRVKELTIYGRTLPGEKGMLTDVWTEALPRVQPLLVALRRTWFSGQMRLDRLRGVTLDGTFFSGVAELGTFFGCVPRLRTLAINVATVGRGNDSHQSGLRKELDTPKVAASNLHPRWIQFLLAGDGAILFEKLRELDFVVTSEVDSRKSGVNKLFGRAPRLDSVMLLDWRGSQQNLNHQSCLL
ncbi:hypothetical protein IW262DRAFT_1468711 [Armillaria fumosa]|nr:hypothetical protein IW262DRAFT_1468711 [Armillaria fumosa]